MADIEKPGSYNDFLKSTESVGGEQSRIDYGVLLQNYRLSQAARLGISLEELHTQPLLATKEA